MIDDMMGGPGGKAFEDLARRFGIDPGQVSAAAAALMPAFAEAMRRSAADPKAAVALLQAWQRSALAAFAPGDGSGAEAAAALFGNETMRAAIAEQAARASGLSGEMMRTLLPPLAATFMANMASAFARAVSPTPPPAAAGAAAAEAMTAAADAFTQFMKGMAQAPRGNAEDPPKASAASPDPLTLARELAERQSQAMQSIFESFAKPAKPGN